MQNNIKMENFEPYLTEDISFSGKRNYKQKYSHSNLFNTQFQNLNHLVKIKHHLMISTLKSNQYFYLKLKNFPIFQLQTLKKNIYIYIYLRKVAAFWVIELQVLW